MVKSRVSKWVVLVALGFGSLMVLPQTALAQRRRGPSRQTKPRVVVKPKVVLPARVPVVKPGLSFRVSLPGAVTLSIGGAKYYRHGNLHYRHVFHNGRWVYIVVPPPAGTYVTKLPESPERVVVNGQTYFRANGAFYAENQPVSSEVSLVNFVVTEPPVGAVVDELPIGYEQLNAENGKYFKSNDSYFLKIAVADTTKYVVVEKPK